jgi:tight adherence protein B
MLESDVAAARAAPWSSSKLWTRFVEDVDVAQLRSSPDRIAALAVAVAGCLAGAGIALGSPALVLVVPAAPLVARLVVSSRASAQRREFEAQLADNLQIVASAMRAGHSFIGALAVAVEDAAEPARRELQRAVTDERLGVSLEEALNRVALRMRNDEIRYVGMVANLQRETGGNTADVLARVTETIRERAELRRLVRTLTAQGRLGGIIVSALPVGVALFYATTRPGYFDPLTGSAGGRLLMALAALMLLAGWLVIRKIVDIKV